MKKVLLVPVLIILLISYQCTMCPTSEMSTHQNSVGAKDSIDLSNLAWLNNDSLEFGLFMPRSGNRYGLRVTMGLDEKRFTELVNIKREQWLKLLNESNFDWAANIYLYYLCDKDASSYERIVKTRLEWIYYNCRDSDIHYWRQHLMQDTGIVYVERKAYPPEFPRFKDL